MHKNGRRGFLKQLGAGAVTASSITRALAIPANNRRGSIEDVEHIVVLTQENRSFDHYFGTLRGVRGFGDPRAVNLLSGKSVWHQPNGSGELLPFRPNVPSLGATFLPDPPHGWNDTHAAWNGGRHDQWMKSKILASFTYNNREDIPYHYALADAFTICDAYHCSVMGPTDPNRYHLWTGWVGNDGAGGGPVITNAEVGYDWSTFPELLERAGISWKVYQDIGVGLTAAGSWGWTGDQPYIGNYGDNALLYFHQYQNAQPGNALADRAKTGTNIRSANSDPTHLVDIFRDDVRLGKLPQVSYIVAPEAYSEHPNWATNFGAWYISQFLDVLASYPEVFSKTVFLLNYDEEGGFFDHQVPPTPPQTRNNGLSTVSTVNEVYPGDTSHPSAPYGLGMRVPLIVISPWSRGGWVNSEVFDHTSVIRFIEKRFARSRLLLDNNTTPWRRAVAGDLTSAFNFDNPNSTTFRLPATSSYKPANLNFYPDYKVTAPANQSMPRQEPGIRPARAVPYRLNAHGALLASDASFQVDFTNTGKAAAVFQVRSASDAHLPRTYTVEPFKTLSDNWLAGSIGLAKCDLSVYGPNGFFRSFKGSVADLRARQIDVRAEYNDLRNGITLTLTNFTPENLAVSVRDAYTRESLTLAIAGGHSDLRFFSVGRQFGWYDLLITVKETDIEYRVAGHLETGRDSFTDPAIGATTA